MVESKKKALMYLGPNLPGGALFSGSVYKQMPEHINSYFIEMPELENMFIEITKVSEFKKELGIKGSEAARLYNAIAAYFSGKRQDRLNDGRNRESNLDESVGEAANERLFAPLHAVNSYEEKGDISGGI